MQHELELDRLSPRLATIEELANSLSSQTKCKKATQVLRERLMRERLREEINERHT